MHSNAQLSKICGMQSIVSTCCLCNEHNWTFINSHSDMLFQCNRSVKFNKLNSIKVIIMSKSNFFFL